MNRKDIEIYINGNIYYPLVNLIIRLRYYNEKNHFNKDTFIIE